MSAIDPIDILNRLLVMHHRSLARYLSYASPVWLRGDEPAKKVLEMIAAEQQRFVDQLGEMIVENGGAVQFGSFPMSFTGYHDLSFGFLLDRLLEFHRRDVKVIEECVSLLGAAPLAKALAQEALGAARGHLELLEERKQGAADAGPR
ncbi:MAG: hypothetical protein ACC628_09040 [Pirellulaceae bacterium]